MIKSNFNINMCLKKVYYFTQTFFREQGWSGYNELVCLRLLEGDSRISNLEKEYHNKGNVFQIDYLGYPHKNYDLDFEKERLQHFKRYDKIGKITIKDASNESSHKIQ